MDSRNTPSRSPSPTRLPLPTNTKGSRPPSIRVSSTNTISGIPVKNSTSNTTTPLTSATTDSSSASSSRSVSPSKPPNATSSSSSSFSVLSAAASFTTANSRAITPTPSNIHLLNNNSISSGKTSSLSPSTNTSTTTIRPQSHSQPTSLKPSTDTFHKLNNGKSLPSTKPITNNHSSSPIITRPSSRSSTQTMNTKSPTHSRSPSPPRPTTTGRGVSFNNITTTTTLPTYSQTQLDFESDPFSGLNDDDEEIDDENDYRAPLLAGRLSDGSGDDGLSSSSVSSDDDRRKKPFWRRNRVCLTVSVTLFMVLLSAGLLTYFVILPKMLSAFNDKEVMEFQQIRVHWVGNKTVDIGVNVKVDLGYNVPVDVKVSESVYKVYRYKPVPIRPTPPGITVPVYTARVAIPGLFIPKSSHDFSYNFNSSMTQMNTTSIEEFVNEVITERENKTVETWGIKGSPRLEWGKIGIPIHLERKISFSVAQVFKNLSQFNITIVSLTIHPTDTKKMLFSATVDLTNPYALSLAPQMFSFGVVAYYEDAPVLMIQTPADLSLEKGGNTMTVDGVLPLDKKGVADKWIRLVSAYLQGKSIDVVLKDFEVLFDPEREKVEWLASMVEKWEIPFSFSKDDVKSVVEMEDVKYL